MFLNGTHNYHYTLKGKKIEDRIGKERQRHRKGGKERK